MEQNAHANEYLHNQKHALAKYNNEINVNNSRKRGGRHGDGNGVYTPESTKLLL